MYNKDLKLSWNIKNLPYLIYPFLHTWIQLDKLVHEEMVVSPLGGVVQGENKRLENVLWRRLSMWSQWTDEACRATLW